MKIVNTIFKGKVNIPTGVAAVIRMFVENIQIFNENKIEFNLHAVDVYHEIKATNSFSEQSSTVIKGKVTRIAIKNYFLTVLLMNRLFDFHAKRVVKKHLSSNKKNCDILLFHDVTTAYYYLKYSKNTALKKYILVLHTDGSATKMLYERFPAIKGRMYERKLINRFKNTIQKMDRLIFVSEKSKNNFHALYSSIIDKKRVLCIHNGIPDLSSNEKELKNIESKIRLINVSSVSLRKGQDIFLKAFENLSLEERDLFEINIVGSGEKMAEYKDLVIKNKLSQIFFLGIRRDVPELLNQADAFIMPSREEGLPIAIIEAMRAGLPIISSDVGGIAEMVDESNGYLIQPTVEDWTIVLKKLIKEKDKLIAKGKESRKKFEQDFTVKSMIEKYALVINEL